MNEQSFNVGDRVRAIDSGPTDAMIFVDMGSVGTVVTSHQNKYDGFSEVYGVEFDTGGTDGSSCHQVCIPTVIEKIEFP